MLDAQLSLTFSFLFVLEMTQPEWGPVCTGGDADSFRIRIHGTILGQTIEKVKVIAKNFLYIMKI